MSKHSCSFLSVYAEVPGYTLDVTSISCSFAPNALPSATLIIPLGREGRTGMQSYGHLLAATFSNPIPVKVYISINSYSTTVTGLRPAGTYLLFSGFIIGAAYKKTATGTQLEITAIHWAVATTFSSMLSSQLSPNSAFDLSFALPFRVGNGVGPDVATAFENFFKSNMTDLWSEGIQPFIAALLSEGRFAPTKTVTCLNELIKNDNKNDTCKTIFNTGFLGQLQFKAGFAGNIAQDIHNDLLEAVGDTKGITRFMAANTVWSFLESLAKRYFFSIIPFPDAVKIVPTIDVMRNAWTPRFGYSILLEDIISIVPQYVATPPVRAVVCYGNMESESNAANAGDSPIAWSCFVGRDSGMIFYMPLPPYIQMEVTATTKNAVNDIGKKAIGTAVAPKSRVRNKQENKDRSDFAQLYYTRLVLQNRKATIACPLRFDICPGSTIRIIGPSVAYVADVGEPFYGYVNEVKYSIDCQNKIAATIYKLSYLRSEQENAQDAYSLAEHPLYQTSWYGEYLLAGPDQNRTGIPDQLFGLEI